MRNLTRNQTTNDFISMDSQALATFIKNGQAGSGDNQQAILELIRRNQNMRQKIKDLSIEYAFSNQTLLEKVEERRKELQKLSLSQDFLQSKQLIKILIYLFLIILIISLISFIIYDISLLANTFVIFGILAIIAFIIYGINELMSVYK